ncbi:MAG: response regulator [Terriglobia bacterium]|jgi:ActR/RegA family two-component response regulator
MYIQYTGFNVAINSRIYTFHVLDPTREPREFTVRIHSDTNLWGALKLQDGPGICFERLEQELSRETAASCAQLDLHISQQDIREYLARHYPPVKTFGHKDPLEVSAAPFIAPAIRYPAMAGRPPTASRSDPRKEVVAAILLHRAGDAMALLKLALEGQAIQICWLTTFQEALPMLQDANPPHLVFTEAKLPDGIWADVVKQAIGARKPMKVIVVSRLVDVDLYVDAMEGGAFDFIVPPLSTSELTHVVKCAVENVRDLRRAQPGTA